MTSPEDTQGVDNSNEAIRLRLSALQEPLGKVVAKAHVLFDEVFDYAQHPVFVDRDYPIVATRAINVSRGGELIIKLGDATRLSVSSSPGYGPSWPELRIRHVMPQEELKREVNIVELSEGSRSRFKYHVETSDFDGPRHHAFIGAGYVDQMPFVQGVSDALDTAVSLAKETFDFTVEERQRAAGQRTVVNIEAVDVKLVDPIHGQ